MHPPPKCPARWSGSQALAAGTGLRPRGPPQLLPSQHPQRHRCRATPPVAQELPPAPAAAVLPAVSCRRCRRCWTAAGMQVVLPTGGVCGRPAGMHGPASLLVLLPLQLAPRARLAAAAAVDAWGRLLDWCKPRMPCASFRCDETANEASGLLECPKLVGKLGKARMCPVEEATRQCLLQSSQTIAMQASRNPRSRMYCAVYLVPARPLFPARWAAECVPHGQDFEH